MTHWVRDIDMTPWHHNDHLLSAIFCASSISSTFICVTWRIRVCNITHLYMWYDTFIRGICRIHICDIIGDCDHAISWCAVYILRTHTQSSKNIINLHIYVHICVFIRYIEICQYIHAHTCREMYTHRSIHRYKYICQYTWTSMCVAVYSIDLSTCRCD